MRADLGPLLLGLALLASRPAAAEIRLGMLSEQAVAEAHRSAEETVRSLGRPEPATWDCAYEGREGYLCTARGGVQTRECDERRFLPPFPVASGRPSACDGAIESYTWVTVDKARDGSRVLDGYLAAAERGLACQAPTCEVVLATNELSVGGDPASGLVRCEVERVGDTLGAPSDCGLVALRVGDRWLLRVVSGLEAARGFMGLPDFDLVVYAPKRVDSGALLGAIKRRLGGSPLSLLVDPRRGHLPRIGGTDAFIAVARHRHSKILGLWEWVTVRVDRYDPRTEDVLTLGDGKRYSVQAELQVSLSLLVNNRATDEYRPPNDAEFAQYLDVVRTAVGFALEEACQSAEWLDAETLLCTL